MPALSIIPFCFYPDGIVALRKKNYVYCDIVDVWFVLGKYKPNLWSIIEDKNIREDIFIICKAIEPTRTFSSQDIEGFCNTAKYWLNLEKEKQCTLLESMSLCLVKGKKKEIIYNKNNKDNSFVFIYTPIDFIRKPESIK